MRLLRQALHAPGRKGVEAVTDSWDSTAHQRRKGLRGQPPGTGQDDVGPAATAGVRRAAVGLQLETFIIGQGSDKEWWFPSPSIPTGSPIA